MRYLASVLALLAAPALAQNEAFHPGPAIPDFGAVASVDSDQPAPKNARYKIRFDVSEAARRRT